MKLGFSCVNFPHRDYYYWLQYAKENGFDFVEVMPGQVINDLRYNGDKIAGAIKESGIKLVIHHALPDPDKPEAVEWFQQSIDIIYEWYEKYKLLSVLSFDTWVDREKSTQTLLDVLERFKDTDVIILTEDCPLNETQMEMWQKTREYKNFGLLIDLGHMNVRLSDTGNQPVWCLANENEAYPLERGDCSTQAFYNAIKNKPLPIYEFHVHNNDGKKDLHESIMNGTADYREIMKILAELRYDDVMVDFEVSPVIHGVVDDEAEKVLLGELEFWKKNWKELKKEEFYND